MDAVTAVSVWIRISALFALLPAAAAERAQNTITINVGVILGLDWYGKTARSALELAVQDVNNNRSLLGPSTRLVLYFNHSTNAIHAAIAARELLQDKRVVAIIGPQTSQEASFVAELCSASKVPMITYSATNPLLSVHRHPFFFRLAQSDGVQAQALAELVSHFGWRNVVLIHSDDDYGTGIISCLGDALRGFGSTIASLSAIPVTANDNIIAQELYKLMMMDAMYTRVFILHMMSSLGTRLLAQAKTVGMMTADCAWIVTEGLAAQLDVLPTFQLETMHGVLATRSLVARNPEFSGRWTARFEAENPSGKPERPNVYACYAYDAVSMLGHALSLIIQDPRFRFSGEGDVPVFQQGDQLRLLLTETDFQGVSGRVRMIDGERAESQYEILNVVGNSYQRVGFWNNTGGLTDEVFHAIVWPGPSPSPRLPPRGWVIPSVGKNKMRIGVPVKGRFPEFVMFQNNTLSKEPELVITGGFVIDVFNAVLKRLPYAVPHELVAQGNHISHAHYDEIINMVYNKTLDAAVGDFTILANRSNYVDFTQPYYESGLMMIVPVKNDVSNIAWAFLKPFTPAMWCTTTAFFVFTGSVVWVLEHRQNAVFRGKPRKQVVTCLWFSFSTFFFVQKEKTVSTLTKAVMIIWLFVVLILNSSYTASLTSILTVEQMEPMVPNVQYLIESGKNVGYEKGTYVRDFLAQQLKIPMHKLRAYQTPNEYLDALTSGEVAAFFDEIPYVRLFLSQHCGFTTVYPTYRTGGLGFVFPRGSPLVSDISKAVLELSESAEIQQIQQKWFNKTACAQAGAEVDFKQLSLGSFWGLYLVTGTASALALLVFLAKLVHAYLSNDAAGKLQWPLFTRIKSVVAYMDQRKNKQQRQQHANREKRAVTVPSTPETAISGD